MRTWGTVTALLAAATTGLAAQDPPDPVPALPPPGLGSMRQDDIAVLVNAGNVMVRFLPLDEHLLRLLTPDSYESMHALRAAHDAEIRDLGDRFGTAEPSVFLVTLFAAEEQAHFDPERVSIVSRNRLFRPLGIMPLSPLWNQFRIPQRETLSAIYVFEGGISTVEPFSVDYAGFRSDEWGRRLGRIERERARIRARRPR